MVKRCLSMLGRVNSLFGGHWLLIHFPGHIRVRSPNVGHSR
ncbi:hypothetical protein B005_1984 [Nocardiopsis alba ATCC BAA-2165]|uniref:Uncharacterized protein n=1 Tax=Nocardiopsis alba (strain ATCC BAA-2165 / BE74) TaxID=1205910 RepID=J7KZJ6_NOCAA|nr:hypothetical protein B005_1984 [Nocardiopsis alba ATCC BAA-2165]